MEVQEIALRLIEVDSSRNHRVDEDPDGIALLAADIRRDGLINPITARVVEGGYRVVAGFRRVGAFRLLGRSEIPAVVREMSEGDEAGLRMAENILQKALSPVEEALAIAEWLRTAEIGIDEAAVLMGRRREWVAGRLEIQSYPDELQGALHAGAVTLGVARQLAQVDDVVRMVEMFRYVHSTGANSRTVAGWVADWVAEKDQPTYEAGQVTSPDQTYRPVVPMTTCAICEQSIRLSLSSQVCLCQRCVPVMQEVGRTVREQGARNGS